MARNEVAPSTAKGKVGLAQSRVCRDVPFLLLFIIYWVGMFIVAEAAFRGGDIRQLTVPKDYLGNYCGINNSAAFDFTNKPYLYYLNPFNISNPRICVASCPNVTQVVANPTNYLCKYGVTATVGTAASLVSAGDCAAYNYYSSAVLNRCLPAEPIPTAVVNTSVQIAGTTLSVSNLISASTTLSVQVSHELSITWPLIAIACAASILVTYFWVVIMQLFVDLFVWLTILLTNVVAILCAVFLYLYWQNQLALQTAKKTGQYTSVLANGTTINFGSSSLNVNNEIQYVFYTFIAIAVIAGLILLFSIAMARRVAMAIRILKEASGIFARMKTILLFPIAIVVVLLVLFTYFIGILCYLLTPVTPSQIVLVGYTLSGSYVYQGLIWYHLAGFIWAYMFVLGTYQVTVAGAVGEFYWTLDKKQKIHLPVMRSLGRTCRYHLGSIAIGSLLITIVELIRLFLYQLQRQVSKSSNPYLKYLVACAQCCMKCVEVIVKFINRNAYVYIAITGQAFFKAAGAATALLLRNAAKLVAVNIVAEICIFFSKLIVAAVASFASYVILIKYPQLFNGTIENPYITVAFVAVATYLIASILMSTYHTAIDTIFLSVLEDLEKNDGSPERPYYMTDRMKKIMGAKVVSFISESAGKSDNRNSINIFSLTFRRCHSDDRSQWM
ncbi:plasma-membrane choline transporter-domain-containing protein [Gorgonomyces haynaldii]|nr:plasma-membrane choline transporter-domain-containing protein [Gorgonomyces haynaldii]